MPKLQSSKNRGKDINSLKLKLIERSILDSNNIEKKIKDLAGVRLIFYTNTDVDRFINSRVIPERFKVHFEETKIHYPIRENEYQRYQGIHYIVSLPLELAKLPKYKKFSGLRCEIQIQSVLNNAWSDTHHTMGYKVPLSVDFGSKVRKEIDVQMKRIMDDLLIHAGFGLQKVQKDFEHYMRGKTLYDQKPLEILKKCTDNNERYRLLSDFYEYVMPYFDNIHDIFPSILDEIENTINNARITKVKPMQIGVIKFEGKTFKDIISLALKIIKDFRYVEPERNFKMLIKLYKDETNSDVQKLILDVVEKLSEYNPEIWRQTGIGIQEVLIAIIEKLNLEEARKFAPVIITVWKELLKSDMESVLFSYDKMTITKNALPMYDGLKNIRKKAINGLITLFDKSTAGKDKIQVLLALWQATRTPAQAAYSNELFEMILGDAKQIVDLLFDRIKDLSYELFDNTEQHLLYEYRRAKQIVEAKKDEFRCRTLSKKLLRSILKFRDKINADIQYRRYKILVGCNSVFSKQWDDETFGPSKIDKYRKKQSQFFLNQITHGKEEEWFSLIQCCSEIESSDWAVFSVLGEFLINLSKVNPSFVLRLIGKNDIPSIRFLPEILSGLSKSSAIIKYKKIVEDYIRQKIHLHSLAIHCLRIGKLGKTTIKQVLTAAIYQNELLPVIVAIAFSVKNHDPKKVPLNDIFIPAVKFLTKKKNTQWVQRICFIPEVKNFVKNMDRSYINLLLTNLECTQKITHEEEIILMHIAENYPKLVLNFFLSRLDRRKKENINYEAIPFQFYGLENELGKDTNLLIAMLRKWHQDRKYDFNRYNGRFLNAPFQC